MKSIATVKVFWTCFITFVLMSLFLLSAGYDTSASAQSATLKVPCGISGVIVQPPTSTSLPTRTPTPTAADPGGQFDHILPGSRNAVAANPCPSATPTQAVLRAQVNGAVSATPTAYTNPPTTQPNSLIQPQFMGTDFETVASDDIQGLIAATVRGKQHAPALYTIYLEGGVYTLTNGVHLSIGGNTIIHGNDATITGSSTTFLIGIASYANVELHHLIIRGGSIGGPTGYGGGLVNFGKVAIFDSTFIDNHAQNGGGAIVNSHNTETNAVNLTITRTAFINNSAGGGGAIQSLEPLNVTCSRFGNNQAGYGGALLIAANDANVQIHYNTFTNNLTFDASNPNLGHDIYNLYATTSLNASNNFWVSGTPQVFSDGAPIQTNPTLNYDPTNYYPYGSTQYTPPECKPVPPVPIPPGICPAYSPQSATVTITLKSTADFPGLTQDAIDMGAIGNTTELYLHAGPTINSMRIGKIPLGTSITVAARMLFPEQAPQQKWFGIPYQDLEAYIDRSKMIAISSGYISLYDYLHNQYPGATDNPNKIDPAKDMAWFAGEYNGKKYYTATIDPCVSLPPPTQITFIYDRLAAAQFAIDHAYQNDTLPNAELNGKLRVIKRISQTAIPYANFVYAQGELSITNELGKSGSALFTSQSIWIGGMPMIVGEVNSNAPCQSDILNGGWRYCPGIQQGRYSSYAWALHKALIVHFTNETVPFPVGPNTSDAIEPNSKGIKVAEVPPLDIASFITLLNTGTPNQTIKVVEISNWAKSNLTGLSSGDYIWISSQSTDPANPSDAHGLLVVGWALPMPCYDARFGGNFDFVHFTSTSDPHIVPPTHTPNDYQLYPTQLDAKEKSVVPYVVDYSGPKNGRVQRPIPRPFYCTRSKDVDYKGDFTTFVPAPGYFYSESNDQHRWYFFTLKDSVRVYVSGTTPAPKSYQQVFVSSNWIWTSTDGN